MPSAASYFLTWAFPPGSPRRCICKVGFQHERLGNITTVTDRVLHGREAHEPQPAHRDMIEWMLTHHLDRVPEPDVVDVVLEAFHGHHRIEVVDLVRVLEHGAPQALF